MSVLRPLIDALEDPLPPIEIVVLAILVLRDPPALTNNAPRGVDLRLQSLKMFLLAVAIGLFRRLANRRRQAT